MVKYNPSGPLNLLTMSNRLKALLLIMADVMP